MPNSTFVPFPELQTERLTLRQLAATDNNDVFALRSNRSVNKYLDRKASETIDDASAFIQAINANVQNNNSLYWAIALNITNHLIGTICLFNFSTDRSQAEIGYELLPDYQGNGIMHEALSKVLDFATHKIGLHIIEAYTHQKNISSTRLLEKLKFKEVDTDGDCKIYQLTCNA